MSRGGAYLDSIREQLQNGRNQWKRGDKILEAFGYARRRQTAIDLINAELSERGMYTEPTLSTGMPLDRAIRFKLTGGPTSETGIEPDPEEEEISERIEVAVGDDATIAVQETATVTVIEAPPEADPLRLADRALIVGNLTAAENAPITTVPSASVSEALTVMDIHDYSQLPVLTGERTIRGVVSYKSIARAQLHADAATVAECIDPTTPVVGLEEPLLAVIDHFDKHDAVLVIRGDKTLCGIVTPADIATEFRGMTGPFLLIGQIEEHLRWLINGRVDLKEALAANSELIEKPDLSIADLSMGDLQRILENPTHWQAVGIRYDRGEFCRELGRVRAIRNAVMHFRDLPDERQFKLIEGFAGVVQRAFVARRKATHK